MLSKEQILSAQDVTTKVVDVPEWGGQVTVKTMSAAERDEYEQSIMVRGDDGNFTPDLTNARAKLAAKTMVNANGKLLFPNPEDVKALGKKCASALERVCKAARELNKLREEDVEEEKKPSSVMTSDDSASGSASPSGTLIPVGSSQS